MHKRTSEDKTPSEARPFSVCGWLCGQRQKPEFKSSRIVAKAKENIRFSSEKRMFCGADSQIRTGDLILTKSHWRIFLTIFSILQPYPLQSTYFPSLFDHKISACFIVVCNWLCGQSVGRESFRDLIACTNVVKKLPLFDVHAYRPQNKGVFPRPSGRENPHMGTSRHSSLCSTAQELRSCKQYKGPIVWTLKFVQIRLKLASATVGFT